MKYLILTLLFGAFLLISCEDPVPNDYIPINLIEALLIVDKPIDNIRITRSLPINQEYYYEDAVIKDAECYIFEGNIGFKLSFRNAEVAQEMVYYYDNPYYLVKPNTEYKLRVILANGDTITGTTITPNNEVSWIKQIEPQIQYPFDTATLPSPEEAKTE